MSGLLLHYTIVIHDRAQLSKRTTFKFKRGSSEIKTLVPDKHM